MAAVKKPKLAVWKFASCDGCQLSLLDCENELLAIADAVTIANFPEASRAVMKGPYDISLVEGSITTPHDAERIHRIRRISKSLVTIGACATAGGIQALRNFADVNDYVSIVYANPAYIKTLNKSTPIADHVFVDFELRGCPINKYQLIELISAVLNGRKPNIGTHSVCMECKMKGNVCVMIAAGTPCLGPITQAGCGAICPSYNRGCFGCFGPKETPNTKSLAAWFEHLQIPRDDIVRAFRGFNAYAEPFRKRASHMKSRTIKVDYLARVEGEGGLYVKIKDNGVADVRLNIFEPPRFFEALLRGRRFTEAPDITARICGICPVAYQMSSSQAMESVCGVSVTETLRDLRRLIYCGEWIESHVLHIYMLHAPDFLGYQDAISMAKDHPDVVNRALKFKKIGNDLMVLLGGREIHPVSPRVGGFYKAPTKESLAQLVEPLQWALDAALETCRWTSSLPFPDFERDYEFVSLRHPDEYPITEGRIVSNKGIDITTDKFLDIIEETHVAHSTSLQAKIKVRDDYLAGPLARYCNNFDRLPEVAQEAARSAGLSEVCKNPFKSIVVRSVETVFACHEAMRIIEKYEVPDRPFVEVPPQAGVGHGCTEAPRGLLYHRYEIDENGIIKDARIIPPTSQNQKAIEKDLRQFAEKNLDLSDEKLTWQCEQMVRNYDPCISCSCHFLKLDIQRD